MMRFLSKKHDNIFLFLVIALVLAGIIFQFSASSKININSEHYNPNLFLKNHIFRLIVGIIIALPFYFINYKRLKDITPLVVGLSIISLVAVLIYNKIHPHATGTARWLKVGPMMLQPAEFAKFALILFFAAFYEDFRENLDSFKKGFLPVVVMTGIFFILIVLEKDYSSAAVTVLISGFVIVIGGAKLKHWGTALLIFISSSSLAIGLMPYRRQRIVEFLQILRGNLPIKKIPYQIQQSLVSLGNGKFFGTGLGESVGKNQFLPEPNTDFIFSIIGEEVGFIGALVVLTLFLAIFYRGLKIAFKSDDIFGVLLGTGLVSSLFIYTLLNVGVTCSLLPVTGLPLPFISYGGTAVLFNSIAVAIILNISKGKKMETENLSSRVINTHAE